MEVRQSPHDGQRILEAELDPLAGLEKVLHQQEAPVAELSPSAGLKMPRFQGGLDAVLNSWVN